MNVTFFQKMLDGANRHLYYAPHFDGAGLCGLCVHQKRGGIAQLGERLHGMQEVSGSIPLTSTTIRFTGVLPAQDQGPHRLEA